MMPFSSMASWVGLTTKSRGSSDESRSQQAKEGLAVQRELGAASGTPSDNRKFKNSRR